MTTTAHPGATDCPRCGNRVEANRSCSFCAYADSVGMSEEVIAPAQVAAPRAQASSGSLSLDLPILGGFLNNKYVLQKALEMNFSPEMLELDGARRLGKFLVELFHEDGVQGAWDKVLIRNRLKAKGQLSAVLDQLFAKVLESPTPTLDQVLGYVNLVKVGFSRRVMRDLAGEMQRYVGTSQGATETDVNNFVAKSVDQLRSLQKLAANKRINLVGNELDRIVDNIEGRETKGEIEIIGHSVKPFTVLNRTISGLRKGFLYCLAGAPRRGKTNLALDIACYCARENKVPVMFFTFEQTKMNLTYRLLSKESYINPSTLQRKRILNDPIQKAKLTDGLKRMADYRDHLYVIEATKEDTIEQIRAQAYNVMQEHDTRDIVLFIDYIQKVPLASGYDNEKFKVEEISTLMKQLSIELNCPIFAISSLSKEGCAIDEKDDEERPSFFHCKGSGDIEYDVDSAMVLGKDWGDTKELYNQLRHKAESMNKDPHRLPKVDIVNLYIDKNRDAPEGILGTIQYFFFIEENKYIELGYKLDTDVYRFKKIENLVSKLAERDFIKFYDIDDKSAAGMGPAQFDQMAAPQDDMVTGGEKKRIRLKY